MSCFVLNIYSLQDVFFPNMFYFVFSFIATIRFRNSVFQSLSLIKMADRMHVS